MRPIFVDAITLDHIIAARSQMDDALLFHELVHVVQYRLLGVHEFARSYAAGFLKTRSYLEIPLERSAFELESRFVLNQQPFDVEAEVRKWIDSGRF